MDKVKEPFEVFLPEYLDWLELEKGLSKKTQENYKRFLKRFLKFLEKNNLNDLYPHQLTPDHIWKYRIFLARQNENHKNKQPLKKSTQNYYLIALRSLLSYFAEKDIQSLPLDKVKLPKTKKDEDINFLNLDQIKKLLNEPNIGSLSGLRDKAILEVFFSTGLRASELAALDREQINIKKNTDTLEISVVGKGERVRTVFLSKRSIKWLRKYLKTRDDDSDALFINYRGKNPKTRLSVRSLERIVKKHAIAAGLPTNTSCHTLRHSFATDLLNKGADLRAVQEFLGHKNIVTTQIYTHVTKPHLKKTHQQFHGIADEDE